MQLENAASKAVVIAMLLASLLLFAGWFPGAIRTYRLSRERLEEIKQEYEQVKKENARYEEAIRKLYRDEYIELIARRELHMIKPDEKAYIVVFADRDYTQEDILELLTEER